MVERFFRDLKENQLRRGVFRSVEELIPAIDQYIDRHYEHPKPFIWTAKGYGNDSFLCRAPHDTDHAEFRGMRSSEQKNSQKRLRAGLS